MPKKNMTEEEKLAWGAKMQAARAAKKAAEQPEEPQESEPFDPAVIDEKKNGVSESEFKELLAHVKELQAKLEAQQTQQTKDEGLQSPQFNNRGGLVGVFEKYTVNPSRYPDPRERLAKEPRLAPLAFDYNYELTYDVSTTSYETRDGISTKEPRFNVSLNRIVLDDTGAQTNGRYIVKKLMFHEDPQAAITIANDNGVDVQSLGEKEFLDEMRYLRMRDWLLEVFYPVPADASKRTSERVYGNTLVPFFEVSSTEDINPLKNLV